MQTEIKDSISQTIKSIDASNISKYDDNVLIQMINKTTYLFFDLINRDALKLIKKEVFAHLNRDCFNSLKKENLNLLAENDKVQYFSDNFLNHIRDNVLKNLSSKFFEKIKPEQIKMSIPHVIKILMNSNQFKYLENHTLKELCSKISFSDYGEEKIVQLIDILYNRGKLSYITGENYISLEKLLDSNKMEKYLDKLKDVQYLDNKKKLDNFFLKNRTESVLEEDDIKIDEDEIDVKNEEIKNRIDDYLSIDNYNKLKVYCEKCCKDPNNKQTMLNYLYSILKCSKNNIYELQDEFEIRRILILLNKGKEEKEEKKENKEHFKRLKQILKDMQNIELTGPDEFITKLNLYSQIINEESFDINFLEILAEENLKNIKSLLSQFYSGTDKDAVPNKLRLKHVDIINDYIKVIKDKYNIKDNKIYKKLEKIQNEKDEEEMKTQLLLFENSLDKYEKLYYDLMIQSMLEQPTKESWVESYATPLFKVIRNFAMTLCGIKLASLTGSTILTSLTATVGGAAILKNIHEEYVKSYFSLKEGDRRTYHINVKNTPKSGFFILKAKLKEKSKKYFNPVKKFFTSLFRKGLLKLKDTPKIGFEKNYISTNIEEEYNYFRNKEKEKSIENKENALELKKKLILIKINKKFINNSRTGKPKEITKFFEIKKKLVEKLIEKRENKLKEKYPEFTDDSYFSKIKKIGHNAISYVFGAFKSLTNVMTFGVANHFMSKKNNIELRLEMLKNSKYKQFKEELEKIENDKETWYYEMLNEDIKYQSKLSSGDYKIFKKFDNKIKMEKKEILEEKKNLTRYNINNKSNTNENVTLNKDINSETESIIESSNGNFNDFEVFEMKENLIQNDYDYEENINIINTNTH